jgi:hypothetical protein
MVRLRPSSAAFSAIALLAMLAPRQSVHAQDAAKGGLLLAEARKALGGEDKLAAIKRLQVSGTFLRSTGPDQVIDGDFDVLMELPDKYRRNEITGFAGANVERAEILNGDQVADQSSGGLTPGGGFPGGGGFGRNGRGGGDRGGGGFRGGGFGGGRNQPPNAGAAQQDPGSADERLKDQQRRVRQAELARLALVWLVSVDGPVAWIGTAQAPEGTADVLEVRPANGVPTRLFLDPSTHMPLMITWSGQPSRGGDIRRRGAPAPSAAATPAQGQATLELHMGEYKTVSGIKLPHLITRGTEGITQEELKIKSFKINPNFKADTFTQ